MKQHGISAKPLLRRWEVPWALACLLLWFSFCTGALAQGTSSTEGTAVGYNIHATHVLGFVDTRPNASGSLAIQGESLRFENRKKEVAQVKIDSIQAILLSQQDKQVGGVPMTLGKAAVPFAGGRVVSLFSHKKYDDIAVLYRDKDGGVHGAIFQVPTGEGAKLRDQLVSKGAHVGPQENSPNGQMVPEVSDANN